MLIEWSIGICRRLGVGFTNRVSARASQGRSNSRHFPPTARLSIVVSFSAFPSTASSRVRVVSVRCFPLASQQSRQTRFSRLEDRSVRIQLACTKTLYWGAGPGTKLFLESHLLLDDPAGGACVRSGATIFTLICLHCQLSLSMHRRRTCR